MMKKNTILTLFMFSALLLLSSCVTNIDPELLSDLGEEVMEKIMKEDINKILKKLTKDMTFEEALVSGYYYQNKKDQEMMIKCYERALTVGGKQALMKRVTMQLAESYILQRDYEKAIKHANSYVTLYPGDQGAKKAAFLEIQASYLATGSSDRDQQRTADTIELCYAYKKNYVNVQNPVDGAPAFPEDEYITQIDRILTDSYSKIIESEINIAETYIKRYNHFKHFSALNSAQKRINYIKTDILSKINIENKRLTDLEEYVDKHIRFELSKMIVQPNSQNTDLSKETTNSPSVPV